MNQHIFISYRRDGGEVMAQLLHDRLVQKGYSVFYDIESLRSGPFNEKLYQEIEDCSDFLLILPAMALERCVYEEDWVRKEIAHALKYGKNIIPVMLRGFVFPPELPDDINAIRWQNGIAIESMDCFSAKIDKLIEMLRAEKSSKDEEWNFDSEVDRQFDTLRNVLSKSSGEEDSFSSRIKKRYIDRLCQTTMNHCPQNPFPEKEGKYFSLVCSKEERCMIFAVRYVANLENKTFNYFLEQLPSTEITLDDRTVRHTFFVEYPDNFCLSMDTYMLMFHLMPSHNSLLVNNGVLISDGNKVVISKKPLVYRMGTQVSVEGIMRYLGCNCEISEGFSTDNALTISANPNGNTVVVDLETWRVIKRTVNTNKITSSLETTINLVPNKSYFMLKLDISSTHALTDDLIALGYWYGLFGIQRDIIRAAEMLEVIASPQSLYWLALLFKNDEILGDNEDYLHFLKMAAKADCEKAQLRLSNELLAGEVCEQDYLTAMMLLERVIAGNPRNATALNNLGWMHKKGLGCKADYAKAFAFFTHAAASGSKKAYRHIADIAILSGGTIISYNEGFENLLIAEYLEVKDLQCLFDQYREIFADQDLYENIYARLKVKVSEKEYTSQESAPDVGITFTEIHALVSSFEIVPQ